MSHQIENLEKEIQFCDTGIDELRSYEANYAKGMEDADSEIRTEKEKMMVSLETEFDGLLSELNTQRNKDFKEYADVKEVLDSKRAKAKEKLFSLKKIGNEGKATVIKFITMVEKEERSKGQDTTFTYPVPMKYLPSLAGLSDLRKLTGSLKIRSHAIGSDSVGCGNVVIRGKKVISIANCSNKGIAMDQDRAWLHKGNTELILVDDSGKQLIHRNIYANGFDVTKKTSSRLRERDLIVSAGNSANSGVFKIAYVGGQKERLFTISDFMVTSICAMHNGNMACCLVNYTFSGKPIKGKVAIYTDAGHVIRQFVQNKEKRHFFKNPLKLVEFNNDIGIVDSHEDVQRVISVDKEQKPTLIRWIYEWSSCNKKRESPKPIDLCCNDKFVFVADAANDSVDVVDDRGHFIAFLLTHENGIEHPLCLTLDANGRLWIGMGDGKLMIVEFSVNP